MYRLISSFQLQNMRLPRPCFRYILHCNFF